MGGEGRNKETSQNCHCHEERSGLPASGGSRGVGEKWSDSGYASKAEPVGLVDK